MLVDKQNELMSDLLFTVHQHGGDDVTCKPPKGLISQKATLHVQHTSFVHSVHFFAVVLHDYNVKAMLHKTIRNDDFGATQRRNIVSNGYNIVPALQRCVALKIVVASRPV